MMIIFISLNKWLIIEQCSPLQESEKTDLQKSQVSQVKRLKDPTTVSPGGSEYVSEILYP